MTEPSASNYPAALDTTVTLGGDAVNLASFTLDTSLDASTQTVSVTEDISGINVPCYLLCGTELIYATAKSSGNFTSCDRGAGGTSATTHSNGDAVYVVYAANQFNQLKRAIIAIQTALGITSASVIQSGKLDFPTSSELTIASGSITPTQNWHTVDTEADAASDDLDTIVASGVTDGYVLFLRANNAARTVVIKHNTGNIVTFDAQNITLDETYKSIQLIYDATLAKWICSFTTTATSSTAEHDVCCARLTLTSGTPVTTTDVTGATNIYITPYQGNRIGLYDGSSGWNVRTFTEITVALGTLTSGLPYDIFVYDNAGVVTARPPVAWTNTTTRATALTTQNGVLVKTGATTDRYLGTFYTTSTTTTEDSYAKRFLWNYYNRTRRPVRVLEVTNSWTYTTAAFRAMNNSTSNSIGTVVGWAEDPIKIQVMGTSAPSSGNPYRVVGVGVGSTTVNSAQLLGGVITGGKEHVHAIYESIPAVGYQYYQALEYSEATSTVTWYGDDGGSIISSGILGEVTG